MVIPQIKGVSVGKTYVVLNGLYAVGDVSSYTETSRDEFGKKHKKKHYYFQIAYNGDSLIRFEKHLDHNTEKPIRDTNMPNTLIVYVDGELSKARDKIISALRKK